MNSAMNPGRSIRASSLKQGSRGWVTSRSVVPIRHRSPTRAPVTSTPSVVRFSPNVPGARADPRRSPHQSRSSRAYAYTALRSPPWTLRSDWSSPDMLTPRTATRPATGSFQMLVRTGLPSTRISRGRPTFTDATRPCIAICIAQASSLRTMWIKTVDAAVSEDEWKTFLASRDFGEIIASGRGRDVPVVVPTHFIYDGDRGIRLHLAVPNPIWEAFAENPLALVSVYGDYAYIPTQWNANPGAPVEYGVPTSYYAA